MKVKRGAETISRNKFKNFPSRILFSVVAAEKAERTVIGNQKYLNNFKNPCALEPNKMTTASRKK